MRLQTCDWIDHDEERVAPAPVLAADPGDLELIADSLEPALGLGASVVAVELVARFGSLSGVFGASAEALAGAPGMNCEAAGTLLRLQTLAGRLARAEIAPRPIISSWTAVLDYVGVAPA